MRHAVPVEYLLFLLRPDAVVLVQKVKERTLRLLQRSVGASLKVPQVGEDAFLELLRVFHGSSKRLKPKRQASYNISAGYVEKIIPGVSQLGDRSGRGSASRAQVGGARSADVPKHTGDVFAGLQ